MPPKNKSKKPGKGTKAAAAVDGLSTEEMSKDQLVEHIVRLREELDREREERSYFQLERDKLQTSWDISKRNLEETEAELRNRRRQSEEAKERHRVEITVYKQKLKNVLSEQHNEISEMKADGVALSSLVQNQNMESELRLRRDVECLQADFREMKLHDDSCIKELQLKYQVELMELTNHYDSKIREIEVEYHRKRRSLIEEEDKKRTAEVAEVEELMKSRVATLIEDQDRSLRRAEDFYSGVQETLLRQKNHLTEDLAELERQHAQAERELSATEAENRRLTEAQRDAGQRLLEARRRLQEHKQAKAKMEKSRALKKLLQKELMDSTVEYELLLQACLKVEKERDELLKKRTEAMLDMQQRSGLKNMLLQKKLAALTETLERKQVELCAVLSVSNVDPTASSGAANRLEEIMESKDATISALQEDLARHCKEYDELLHTSRERLRALNTPLQEFSFRPSNQILNSPTPKH